MGERPGISKSGRVRIPVTRPRGRGNYLKYAAPAAVLGGVALYAVAPAPFQRFSEVVALSRLFGDKTPPPPSTGGGGASIEGLSSVDSGTVEMAIVTLIVLALGTAYVLSRRSQVA